MPARIELLWQAGLPATPSGKVDRKALLAAAKAHNEPPHDYAPQTTAEPFVGWESLVARYWAQEMDLPRATLTKRSDFRALSGDSMVALRVCKRLFAHVGGGCSRNPLNTDSNTAHEGSGTEPGVFGEALGQLSPVFLLEMPVLCDYAQHLAMRFGDPTGSDDDISEATSVVSTTACSSSDARAANGNVSVAAIPDGAIANTVLPKYSEFRELLCDAVSATVCAPPPRAFVAVALVQALLGDSGELYTHRADAHAQCGTNGVQRARPPTTTGKHVGGGVDRLADWDGHVTIGLHRATVVGARQAVSMLLACGARVDARGCDGTTPLHVAAQRGHVGVVRDLLAGGANIHAVDNNTQSVLHHAARSGAAGTTMLNLLLDTWRGVAGGGGARGGGGAKGGVDTRGAGVDVVDAWGRTPLHWAVTNGHRTVVVVLLAASAAVDACDAQGETPLAVAERRAQCRANDRPHGLRPSHFGDIATLLGGNAKTVRLKDADKSTEEIGTGKK